MKNVVLFISTICAAALMMQGCKKDTIRVDGSTVSFVDITNDPFTALGGEKGPFNVRSEQDWVIASDDGPNWLSGNPSSGHGDGEFMIVAGFNFGLERDGSVTVQAAPGGTNPWSAGNIKVKQGPVTDVTIILLNEDFTAANGVPKTVADYTGFWKKGEGADLVSYTGAPADDSGPMVRANTTVAPTYSYATGLNTLVLPAGSSFTINQISTGSDKPAKRIAFSFGCAMADELNDVSADIPVEFDPASLTVEWGESADGPWHAIDYRRDNAWMGKSGWDMGVALIDRASPAEYMWIRFTAKNAKIFIDDIFVRAVSDTTTPEVMTAEMADADIQTYMATVRASYVYPVSPPYPAPSSFGARYKLNEPGAEWSSNISGVSVGSSKNFATTFADLDESKSYVAQAYLENSNGIFYGNEVVFQTKPFDEGAPRTSLRETFNSVTQQGMLFRAAGWRMEVTGGSAEQGWLTDVVSGDTRLLSTTDATSYAILPPLDIAGTTTQPLLQFNYGATAVGNISVQVSTDLVNWTEVSSLPIATANPQSGQLDLSTVALGAYASASRLYVAFVAMAPGIFIDNVVYGGFTTVFDFAFIPNNADPALSTQYNGAGAITSDLTGTKTSTISFSDGSGNVLFTITRNNTNAAFTYLPTDAKAYGLQFGQNNLGTLAIGETIFTIAVSLTQTLSGELYAALPLYLNNAGNGNGDYTLQCSASASGPWQDISTKTKTGAGTLSFAGSVVLTSPISNNLYLRLTRTTNVSQSTTNISIPIASWNGGVDSHLTIKVRP